MLCIYNIIRITMQSNIIRITMLYIFNIIRITMRSRLTLILFSPRFPNLHLFSPVVLIDLTLGIGHKKYKGCLSNNQGKIFYSCIYTFLHYFHQQSQSSIQATAVFCENMREDRGLERGESGEMALFDKIWTKRS